jgi:hypothetical protein
MTSPDFGLSRLDRARLVLISETNRILRGDISPDMRVRFLEALDKMTRDPPGAGTREWITHGIIGSIEPACDRTEALIAEATKAGRESQLDIYADTFPTFVALNPSLIAWRDRPELHRR